MEDENTELEQTAVQLRCRENLSLVQNEIATLSNQKVVLIITDFKRLSGIFRYTSE
jgi:hypothetical protein